jgi:DNA-binding transcriptional LysR family regulator
VEQWVLENEVELGVIEGDPASGLLVKEPWYTDELVLVLSPLAPEAGRELEKPPRMNPPSTVCSRLRKRSSFVPP